MNMTTNIDNIPLKTNKTHYVLSNHHFSLNESVKFFQNFSEAVGNLERSI